MMFGHPEAPVAEPLGLPGKLGGVAQRFSGVAALRNGREVEDGDRRHGRGYGNGAGRYIAVGATKHELHSFLEARSAAGPGVRWKMELLTGQLLDLLLVPLCKFLVSLSSRLRPCCFGSASLHLLAMK